jgi:ABC-type proline/glycine betaine transport system ATPase subunit
MPSIDQFYVDVGGAVIRGDTVKVEIMSEAYERAERTAGCPTGEVFQMSEEERMNFRPAPEFVWRAAADIVAERRNGTSARDRQVVEILTPYLPC